MTAATRDHFWPTDKQTPAVSAVAVTPSDSSDLSHVTRALWVGTAGDLVVTMADGTDVTFPNASGWMDLCVSRVKSTGTAASGIVAVW